MIEQFTLIINNQIIGDNTQRNLKCFESNNTETLEEVEDIHTTTYRYKDYLVDIVVNHSECSKEAWIHHEDYGVKHLMFGVCCENDIRDLVLANIDDYIESYKEDIMCD